MFIVLLHGCRWATADRVPFTGTEICDVSGKTNTDINPIRRVDYLDRKQAGEEDTEQEFRFGKGQVGQVGQVAGSGTSNTTMEYILDG